MAAKMTVNMAAKYDKLLAIWCLARSHHEISGEIFSNFESMNDIQ